MSAQTDEPTTGLLDVLLESGDLTVAGYEEIRAVYGEIYQELRQEEDTDG